MLHRNYGICWERPMLYGYLDPLGSTCLHRAPNKKRETTKVFKRVR